MSDLLPIAALTRSSNRFRCTVLPGTPVMPASACVMRQRRATAPANSTERMQFSACADCSDGHQVAKQLGHESAPVAPTNTHKTPWRGGRVAARIGHATTAGEAHAAVQRTAARAHDADLGARMGIAPPTESETTMTITEAMCRKCSKRPAQPQRGPNKRADMAGLCKICKVAIRDAEHAASKPARTAATKPKAPKSPAPKPRVAIPRAGDQYTMAEGLRAISIVMRLGGFHQAESLAVQLGAWAKGARA